LLYLPPYSADLNANEEAFAKLKGLLGKTEARTREALLEPMGRTLHAITVQEAQGFFERRGCRTTAQPL
jgi:transposase